MSVAQPDVSELRAWWSPFHLWRQFIAAVALSASCFLLGCYLIKLDELVTVPKWGRRFHRVIRDLPDELATYKGFITNREKIVEWLSRYDDGAPTSPGIWPD